MKKFLSLTLFALICSFASFALGPITGSTYSCTGSIGTVIDSTSPGGTWSSSNTVVATIGINSGYVYGVSAGTTTLTYTLGGSYLTWAYTVYATPATVTGVTSLCVGGTTQLSDVTPGGTWSSGDVSVATVSSTGMVYGVTSANTYIYYSTGGSCEAYAYITVGNGTIGSIYGPTTVCASGGTAALTDSTSGGVWSCSNTAIATVDPSGIVYGITVGTATISYSLSGTCGTTYQTATINVINTTNAGVISGTSTVYSAGASAALNETVSGGVWSSSNTSAATIDPSTGVYTGVTAGTAVISYTVSGCGGTAVATYTVSVTTINGISGNINFPGSAYYNNVKVWLITYNPSTLDLEAIDSFSVNVGGSASVYYQFLSPATDSYRVKAATYDTTGVTTSYIPTYHTSSFYWNTANVINHTAGSADINENINMMIGTPTSGPGFVGGNVTAGANRGTSTTGIPVVGLTMNLLNSSNQLMQSIRTNASGSYSFSNLPLGTYYVFPDSLNYITTAYTGITLTSGAPSASTANFGEHTVSHTITPNTTGINNVGVTTSSMVVFPNPTTGKINLQWNETATEKGSVIITDITGREIFSTILNLTEGTGVKQLDLSSFASGLYMISVKSGTINYNTKVQVGK